MENLKLILINVALLFVCAISTIPDLMAEENDLTSEYGTLSKVDIETFKYRRRRSFGYSEGQRLALITVDRIERKYTLSSSYKKYWKEFLKEDALGKELRVYLRSSDSRKNPLIVELDRKVIYDKSTILWRSIIILVVTVGWTAYTLYKVFEVKKVTQ